MFELITGFIAAFSASIFLAHTVEAYLAQGTERRQAVANQDRLRYVIRLPHHAYLACLNSDGSVILARRRLSQGRGDMSWQAGVGLLLAIAMVIGGAVGIGLPLAFVIIWLCSGRCGLSVLVIAPKEFAAPFLAAIAIAVLVWAVFGSPAPSHTWIAKRQVADPSNGRRRTKPPRRAHLLIRRQCAGSSDL